MHMKKQLLFLLVMPVVLFAQEKSVLTVSRYFPKADKATLFEKAVGAHAQKYHKADVRWMVFSIESGPDAGGYMVAEGPNNWEGIDNRGDISKAHMDDWEINVQPLLTDKMHSDYFNYRLDLSTADLSAVTGKIAINHLYQKPGYLGDIEEWYKAMKKNWTETDQSVAVFQSSSSGEPQFMTITLYKQGLKERETAFRPPLSVTFAKANGGEDVWKRYLEIFKTSVSHQWGELLFLKPELGSK